MHSMSYSLGVFQSKWHLTHIFDLLHISEALQCAEINFKNYKLYGISYNNVLAKRFTMALIQKLVMNFIHL